MADALPDYTQWPASQDVLDILDSVGVVARNPRRFVPIQQDVITEVGKRTLRQFVADTQDTTRAFDGSGTAEQEIDEIVSLTAVFALGIFQDPGFTFDNVEIVQELNKPQTLLVLGQGSLPAYSEAAVFLPYRLVFPAGRQNLKVTGRWGYAATIPPDLWNAVAGEMAYRLLKESVYQQSGQLIERTAGDEREKYALNAPELLGSHERFEYALTTTYKRPAGRRLRNLRNRAI